MTEIKSDRLDAALANLPRDVEFNADLWPAIRAEIAADSQTSRRRWFSSQWPSMGFMGQLAAGVVLVIASSITTYVLTRAAHQTSAQTITPSGLVAAPDNLAVQTSFDGEALGSQYMKARADLDRLFAERIASLPPATRAKLLDNLADLRRASDEITTTLAQHPTDPLLQELLISTHQRELRLLADVSQLPIPNSQRTES